MKIKDIEKKYQIKPGKDSEMEVKQWLKKEGLPAFAKLLENK